MELREFFAGRWLALILVPAVTAVIAGVLFVSSDEQRYEAEAVVSITEFFGGDSPTAIRGLLDDFDNALASRQVADIVAATAPDTDSFLIQSEALGEGGDVRVSFQAATAERAAQGLDDGVREALGLVSASVGRETGRRLTAANSVAEETLVELQIIEGAAGAADLAEETARRSADLLGLRNQIAAAEGSDAVQAALRDTLEVKEAELQAIEAQLLPWTNLRERFDLAVAAGADATLELRRIETNEDGLQTEDLLQSLDVLEVSNVPDLLRVVVAAAAVTAGTVALISFVLGSDRRRRGLRSVLQESADEFSTSPDGAHRTVDGVAIEHDEFADRPNAADRVVEHEPVE